LESTVFLMAWLFSTIGHIPLEGGYSNVFIDFVHYGMLVYFLLGLLSLRLVLKHFNYTEKAISLTLVAVFLVQIFFIIF